MMCKYYNFFHFNSCTNVLDSEVGPCYAYGWMIAMAGLEKSYCCKLHTVCVVLWQCLHANTGCPILVYVCFSSTLEL